MSMYTKIKLKLSKKIPVSIYEELKNLIKHNCGVADYNHSNQEKIEFHLTYNYGFEKVVDIIELLEQAIDYSSPKMIGTFESENIYSDNLSLLYGYKGHIIAVEVDKEFGFGYTLTHFKLSDLRGSTKVFTTDTNEEKDELLESIFDEFFKSEVRRN